MANVIVAFSKPEDGRNIRNILIKSGYHVAAVCSSGAQTVASADALNSGIVVSGYKLYDMQYIELYECLPPGFKMLLLKSAAYPSETENTDIVCLNMPLKIHDFLSTMEMIDMSMVQRKRRVRPVPAERSGKDLAVINEAKALLMERNHMTEEEAHRYMQKCSMDSGTNMVETAQMVISLNSI